MKNYASIKTAKEIIDCEKRIQQTAFYDGSLGMWQFYEALRDLGVGEAETRVIVSALVLAGAKLTID